MRRHHILVTATPIALALLPLGAAPMVPTLRPAAVASEAPTGQVNVLLITTDDQTVPDVRHMPYTRQLLGDHGVTFTNAISSYPLCCPARATLVTGQLPHNHGVISNGPPYGGYPALRAQPDLYGATIGTWLQDTYDTMFAGKYLNGYGGHDDPEEVPPGWDRWYATAGSTYNYRDFRVNENGTVVPYDDAYQTSVFAGFTRRHIRQSHRAGVPFFIWESQLAPHDACRPSPDGVCTWGPPMPAAQDMHRFGGLPLDTRPRMGFNERDVSDKPAAIQTAARWDSRRVARAVRRHRMRVRSLQEVDRSVRRTVGLLRNLGELDSTLIIFTSDNGYLLGQHRLRGKTLPYEPSLRVPLLMRWPDGGIPEGEVRSAQVALVDLPSTIAEAAGVVPTLTQDGRSLLGIARGEPGARGYGALTIEAGPAKRADSPDWLYQGVRTPRYTYVDYPGSGELELYDRRTDPGELVNVAYRRAYRDTRAALAAKLDVLRGCAGEVCRSVSGSAPPPALARNRP